MPRFFIEHIDTESKSLVITGRDAEHIKVLRMRPGEALTICNGKGIDMHCTLTGSDGKTAYADVAEVVPSKSEASVKVRIYAGLAKGDRVDYVAQKCTEMGAEEIVFFNCDRCVVRLDPKKGADKKVERWQRIAEEAAKQSGRGIIPVVRYIDSYKEMLNDAAANELKLFMYETGDRISMQQAIRSALPCSTAAVICGPEGGFTPEEAELARQAGFAVCAMGPRILRCETAPLIPLTAILYETNNLD